MKYYEKLYIFMKLTLYVLYIVAFFGLWTRAPTYINYLHYYLRTFVAIALIIFFNPLMTERTLTKFHRDIAFSSGVLLITSTTLDSLRYHITKTYKAIQNDLF